MCYNLIVLKYIFSRRRTMKTKLWTKFISIVLCLSMLLSSVGCNNFDEDDDEDEGLSAYQWENAFDFKNVTVTVRQTVDGNELKEKYYVDGGEIFDELWSPISFDEVIPDLKDEYESFTFDPDLGSFSCENIDLGGVECSDVTVIFSGTSLSRIELVVSGRTVKYSFSDYGKTHRDAEPDGICDNCGEDSGKSPTDPGECVHIDANDDVVCDKCGDNFSDGCDTHVDANDDGKCDKADCGKDYTDGCDNHVDANDDGKCDVADCNKEFYDGCDTLDCLDTDGDGRCNNAGCERPTANRPCTHRDADDDNKCDKCGEDFSDKCDMHRDADDNFLCDICSASFSDGCDAAHRDANDDGRCDFGGENYTDGCDNHVDLDDNGVCDVDGCDEFYDDGCNNHIDIEEPQNGKCDICGIKICKDHRDANDDGKCDKCEDAYTDGCDVHRDADDDYKCDKCGTAYTDGCDIHRDADDNGKCDFGNEEFNDGCDNHVDKNDDGICDVAGCDKEFDDGCDTHRDADDDGKCDFCGEAFEDGIENSTSGLEFELNADGESYTIVGIGNCTETDIFISGYNGLPVVAIGYEAFYKLPQPYERDDWR